MLTTTFFPSLRSSSTSRAITSLASADPPGEFTRNTTAFTSGARRASRSAPATVSDPITVLLPSPDSMGPTAYTMATLPPSGCATVSASADSPFSNVNPESSSIENPKNFSGKL